MMTYRTPIDGVAKLLSCPRRNSCPRINSCLRRASTPHSVGTVTTYDARGNVISRESTSSGGVTTLYDSAGRGVGRTTKAR